jgi:hypothetical protein
MEKFAKPGDFCPNEACPDYGKLQNDQQQNLEKFGKTRKFGRLGGQLLQLGPCPQALASPGSGWLATKMVASNASYGCETDRSYLDC